MNTVEVIQVIMQQIRGTLHSETVIGTAVQSGESTIVPVSRISYGFGIGGSDGIVSRKGSTMGAGAGAKIEPMALVVVTGGKAKLLPLKSRDATLACFFAMIPDILEGVRHMFSKKKKGGKPKILNTDTIN